MAEQRLPKGLTRRGNAIRIKVMVRGQTHSETIKGPGDKAHIAACVKRYNEIVRHANDNPDSLALATFSVVAQDYLNCLDVKRSSSLSYTNLLNNYWMPDFEMIKVGQIKAHMIKRVLANRDVSNKTKRNALAVLSGVLEHAEVNPNPCRSVKIKKRQPPPVQRYRPEERQALLDALEGQAKAFFAIMFGGGLRTGEVLGLQWGDWDGERLHLSRSMTRRKLDTLKNEHLRSVVIPSWVRPYINALPSRFAGGHMFLNTKGTPMLDSDLMAEEWRQAHKKAKLDYRIPYTCRHTRAAELLSVGVNPAAAASQLGHTVEMFLRTYSEYIDEYADQQVFDTPLKTNLDQN